MNWRKNNKNEKKIEKLNFNFYHKKIKKVEM